MNTTLFLALYNNLYNKHMEVVNYQVAVSICALEILQAFSSVLELQQMTHKPAYDSQEMLLGRTGIPAHHLHHLALETPQTAVCHF